MEKIFKLILSGIIAGFILFLVASISYNFTKEISDPSIKYFWRKQISATWLYKLLIINAITGIILAIFYSFIQKSLPGESILKGIFFGFMIWTIMITPPLATSFVIHTFSKKLLLSWLAQGLTSYIAAGVSISLIYK